MPTVLLWKVEKYICLSLVGTFIESNNTWNSWFLCEFALLEWMLFLYFSAMTYPATYGRIQVFVVQEIFHSKVVINISFFGPSLD